MGIGLRPVLVTGGAGFIGVNFVRDWLAHDLGPIVSLDKLTYAGSVESLADLRSDPRHAFVRGDIGDVGLVDALLSEHRPRAIVNFAAETLVDRSIYVPADFVTTNIVGTFELLEAVRRYYENLGVSDRAAFRLVHVSSDEVFGALGVGEPGFSETTRYAPNSPYAASKAASDHLARAWFQTYGLPILITNSSNNYGPFQFPEKLIPLMIHNALHGLPLPVYGDGLQIRDWLYVSEHCRAIREVLARGRVGETYNIGSGSEKTNIEVVHMLCDILDSECPRCDGLPYRHQITHVTDRRGHDRRYAVDATKIRRELGWMPVETFESGLAKTVRWYRENATWVERVVRGSYRDWIVKNYAAR